MEERISIAPMMEMTDSHWRMMMRGITRKIVLYTEMVVDDTVNHTCNRSLDYFIGKNIEESPSVIQLGGHDPENLAKAAASCEQYGGDYNEINLNCGCPSQRVSKRCFGAKLMLEPDLVREIVSSMQRKVSIPITVKCRIGADDKDSYAGLFIHQSIFFCLIAHLPST
jgi:tRNA-dihydrouridine synthase A